MEIHLVGSLSIQMDGAKPFLLHYNNPVAHQEQLEDRSCLKLSFTDFYWQGD